MTIPGFNKTLSDFYGKNRRNLDWRRDISAYSTVISEIMLQQTQVARVSTVFPRFIMQFPDFASLAGAPVAAVLGAWQGMGYNRRALYLKKIAEIITEQYNGQLPRDPGVLETFPGIGRATACSIVCFAWNIPTVFIETNIRRVFIHSFFARVPVVSDKEIVPIVEKALDRTNPREWYYSVMDYGSYLPKTVKNPNRRSVHYAKQSVFEGSARKVRGEILRVLLAGKQVSKKKLKERIADHRFEHIISGLIKEGFITENDTMYSIYEAPAA